MVPATTCENDHMEPRISVITLGVADLARSYRFYRDGLGLPTTRRPGDGIVFFQTSGAVLALFPHDELAADVGPGWGEHVPGSLVFTLAHNVRERREVDDLLARAAGAGALRCAWLLRGRRVLGNGRASWVSASRCP